MEKQEAKLKSKLRAAIKEHLPGFLILAYATNGAPDLSIVGGGRQSNWEAKHSTPSFRSPGDQELMTMRMAAAGHCRYIVWDERGGMKKTMIVHPREVFNRQGGWTFNAEAWCVGHDVKWLVEQIRREHAR